MANKGENVILPNNAVFLVHKVGSSKSGGDSQWETRSKVMRAAPDPSPLTTIAAGSSSGTTAKNDAEGAAWEFVSYTPDNDQQVPKGPKEFKRKRRNKGTVVLSSRPVIHVMQQQTLPLPHSPSTKPPDLPVTLSGHTLLYINFYFHAIAGGAYTLPCLRFNPAKRDWFPRMMQDSAWQCLILSLSANALGAMTGSSFNYVDAHTLLDEALRQLKGRVASGGLPSDQTLGAISCLSMSSNESGNFDNAWVHAKGLAELVKLRGGFSQINDEMRSKIYRGVYDIAVDVDRPPLLDDGLKDSSTIERSSDDSPESEESESFHSECRVPPRLASIFQHVVQLTSTVDDAMTQGIKLETNYLYETAFGLFNRLLTCKSDKMSSCHDSMRICLILYIKSIISYDRLNATSANLVRKLQASIESCLHSSGPLTRWKLFIGGLATVDGTVEQQWYLEQLATAMSKNNMAGEDAWKTLQVELSDILWSKPIHETAGYKLWLQIERARSAASQVDI